MLDVLVVGPAGRQTGGIARYIAEQRRQLSACSVRVFDVQTPDGEGAGWFLLGVFSAISRMLAFPFRRRPDVVHVHTSHGYSCYLSAFYVLFGSLIWRRPVILHVHGSAFDEFVESASGPLRRALAFVFAQCAAVVVLSSYWETVLDGLVAPGRLVTMPNAVAASEFEPSFSRAVPHIVFVSNLLPRKGVPEFLTALGRLRDADRLPPYRVTIAGDGPLARDVAGFAERTAEVEYLGYVSESRKRALLEDGTIFVIPSRAEGLPISLLEAMAGGNAVVATSVGSIPEVIDGANGVLVPPGDADALTSAIRGLLEDPNRVEAMARRNRELVADRYSWTARSGELVDLYRTVSDGGSSRQWRPEKGNSRSIDD